MSSGIETSSTSGLKNILIVTAVILAMVISFFIGRATAPQHTGPAAEGDATQTTQDANGDPNAEDNQPPEDIDEPEFAPSQTDPELIKVLADQVRRDPNDKRAIGKVDAPVVMVTYEDFSCPMCTVFFDETFPQLQGLIEDGTLRVEFHDLVIFPNYGSDIAAAASRAAANQDLFWEFTTTAYKEAGAGNHPTYDKNRVLEIAKAIKIGDLSKFEADLASEDVTSGVQAETQHAMQNLGVSGTPFFIINNAVISGARPTPYFIKTIEQQAAEAK